MKNNMRKKIIFFITASLLFAFGASAQQIIKGTVRSQDGELLQGVTVTVKGTEHAVTTDARGNFSIDVGNESTLVFSFVGYRNVSELAKNAKEIVLNRANAELDQVVVVGYGT